MKLLSLGNNFYKLVQEYAPETEKVKIPANTRSITFTKIGDVIRVVRGNLYISVKEIEQELRYH